MERNTIIAIVVPIVVVVVVAAVVAGILLFKNRSSSPLYTNYFGCKNGTCLPGQGTQTYDECQNACESIPTSIGYGCNPKTGKCEIGYGTDDSTCSKSSPCKKLTYKCDTSTWTCNDTNDVTNVSQDKCDCDPQLSLTPYTQQKVVDYANGKGTYCLYGNFVDEDGTTQQMGCQSNTCCKSNFCGSFMDSDPYWKKQCANIADQTSCLSQGPVGNNTCVWSNNKCSAKQYDVGQCTECTKDEDCYNFGGKGTCTNNVCVGPSIQCRNESSYDNTTKGDVGNECDRLFLQNPPSSSSDLCMSETDASACMKTFYVSTCKDRNGKEWGTNREICLPEKN